MTHNVPTTLEGRTKRLAPSELDWPSWIPIAALVIPLGLGVDIVVRHGAFTRTVALGLPVVVVTVITVLPWVLDVVSAKLKPDRYAPEWLFSLVVLTGVAVLLFDPVSDDPAPFLLVFLTGEMASRLEVRGSLAVAGASMAVMGAVTLFGPYDNPFIWLVAIGMGYFAGMAIQSQMRLSTERKLSEQTLTERAASEERQRIAREVHDVIAHSLSVTMLHVTAARMALERGQSPGALESLQEAERQGRASLNDIRRTVGLLGPDQTPAEPPMPAAADLPKLVNDFRTAGLDVTLWMDGEVQSLPPAAGLNLYRIVQESLTNASKHAPGGKARVELNVTEDDIRLRVHNGPGNGARPARSPGSGLGLRGMAERAAMLGGMLATDSDEDGWTVLVTAPRPAADG